MNLLAFVRLCWAHRYTIAACSGRGLLQGFGISTFAMKPRFRSETTLVLTRPAGYSDVPSQAMTGLGGDISAINTQVEILGSARMMHNLALELNLQNDPEFNPAILASRWTVPWQKLADRSDSEALGIVVENVTQAISIKNVRNSDVIRISTTTNDPQKSAEIADTLAQLFCSGSDQRKSRRTDRNCFMVVGPGGRAGAGNRPAGGRHQDPAAANPDALAAQLSETRTRLANLQSRLQELDQLDQTLVDLDPEHFKGEVPEVVHDRILSGLSRQVATGDAAARIALAERVSELIAQNARERAELDHQSRTLSQLLTALELEFEKNASVTAELRQIERDARATRLLHETFLSRLKEAAVQQGAQTPDCRIISTATPGKQVAPRYGLTMFLGVIAGAALGLGIVLVRQIRQAAVPTGSDLEMTTSVPVLGHLPLATIRQRSQLAGYVSTNPTSPLSEAARNLRTSLLSPNSDAPPQVILCTSSAPDEGKTTMSIAFAQSLAGLGRCSDGRAQHT
nr:GNVR domain-containing protein [Ruegeria arenilitoris]